jgi:hypothetical protein
VAAAEQDETRDLKMSDHSADALAQAFGPPIRVEPHEVSSGEVPPYEKRAEILLGEAHALLLAYEQVITGMNLDRVRRWLDRYELHLCQIDHPELRAYRPLGMPPTIEGEVKDE